jgi:hypothetical protein
MAKAAAKKAAPTKAAPAKAAAPAAAKKGIDKQLQRGTLKNTTPVATKAPKSNLEGNPSSAEPQSYGGNPAFKQLGEGEE